MNVMQLIDILMNLDEDADILVEASPSKDYDRTSQIKVVKILKEEYIITDIDSEIYKQKGL